MKLNKIVRAYSAVRSLMDKECSFETAYKLVKLRAELRQPAEFFAVKEMEIIKKCAAKDEGGKVKFTDGGKFDFITDEAAREYAAEMNDLLSLDVDEITPVEITAPDSITPAAIEALDGFVIFMDKEDGKCST